MKIYVNAGHGGMDTGGVSASGRQEKDETLRLARAVKPLLAAAGHTVVMSRESDYYKSVVDIANEANASGADLFGALHFNFYNGRARGTECLVVSAASQKSRQMATEISARIAALGFINRGVKVQDSRTYVLRRTVMPATTVEVCFLDSKEDMALYDRQFAGVARAVADGILAVAGGGQANDFIYRVVRDTPLMRVTKTMRAGERVTLQSYFEGELLARVDSGGQVGQALFRDLEKV